MNRNLLFILILIPYILLMSCGHEVRRKQVADFDSTELKRIEKAKLDSLSRQLEQFVQDPCFDGAVIGYTIYDFSKGTPRKVFEHNSSMGMVPASTQKLFTTAAALEIFGEPVYHEVTITNLNSINWRANRLMQKIGEWKYGKYDFLNGAQAVIEYWRNKNIDIKGLILLDGSGRSHDNLASPRQLAEVLFRMTSSPVFPVFYNSLPLAGISGTMHKWLIGSAGEGRVRAKTGSLDGVRSYAGYIKTVSGRNLIFTLIINNYVCKTKILKQRVEKFMLGLVSL